MIVIESRMKGDHEELTIFLQKCLISSRFNQKLSLREERTSIYKDFDVKIPRRLIPLRGFGWLQLPEIGGP